jgi:4-diphosphocytidyl-2-C-methyl-D-erythritol kinase
VLQRIDLADEVELEPADGLTVEGFEEDTIVRAALTALAEASGVDGGWRVEIDKRIPAASGLGGGSSDAAVALLLANETLARSLPKAELNEIASGLGSDVPFFLTDGPQLATGTGTELTPVALRRDYWVLLVLPAEATKESTGAVYDSFHGAGGFEERRTALLAALESGDLAALPPNDLASSPLAEELIAAGAFRADVSGAGPAVYGLFEERALALSARELIGSRGATWLTQPAW